MDLNQLVQKIFNNKKKLKQIEIVWLCLNYIKEHPEHINIIGIGWIDYSHFIFNCRIFSLFINRIPNTVNSYFRKHGFQCIRMTNDLRNKYKKAVSFESLICYKGWVIHKRDGFTQSTSENDLQEMKSFCTKKKNHFFTFSKSTDNKNDEDMSIVNSAISIRNDRENINITNQNDRSIYFKDFQNDDDDEFDDPNIYFEFAGVQ